MNLMEVMLSHDGRHLVDARGIHTRQQAAYALATFMAQLSGDIDVKTGEVNINKWRAAAHAQLRNLGSVGQDYQWQGLFVADEVTLKKARRLRGQQRQRVVQQGVQQTEFSILLKQNARFIASGELSAGGLGTVLTGIALTASYDEFIKAESADKTHKGMAFTGAVIAAMGEVTELTGVGLAKTPWGNTPLSRQINPLSKRFTTRAALVQGIGRLVGVAGAVILGVAQAIEGIVSLAEGQISFGIGSILLGSATAILAVIVIKLTLGAALVIALLLIAANYIVSLFKRDDFQKWLDKSLFGKQNYYESFKDRFEQRNAFKKLAGAN